MQFVPHDYQKAVAKHIVQYPGTGVFLGMGLGKTSIALMAILEEMYNLLEYLEKYDQRPKGVPYKEREYVCTLEIWCEAFGQDKSRFTNKDSRELSAILLNILGWKLGPTHRFGPYGIQRSFLRK